MLTDDELDQLDALLLSHTSEDCMLLSEFDVFRAGLIVCPEFIMPGEWLSCVWGSSTEHLETPKGLDSVTDLMMRHYTITSRSPCCLQHVTTARSMKKTPRQGKFSGRHGAVASSMRCA